MMREVPWDADRDFPSVASFLQQFDTRYQADLANDLGNLLNRTVSMVSKYRDGVIPAGDSTELDTAAEAALGEYVSHMDALQLQDGLEDVMSIVHQSNGWIDSQAPWALARDPDKSAALDAVLGALIRALARTAVALSPFMPEKSAEIWSRLGGAGTLPVFDELADNWPTQLPEKPEGVLFPRIETTGE